MRETIDFINALFVNKKDAYAEGWISGGRMAYAKKDGLIGDELLQAHITGEKTIGLYQLCGKNLKWGVFDFDENTAEDFEKAKILYLHLIKKGFHPLMENSGGGNFKTHIWIFADSDAVSMKAFMEDQCREAGVMPHEIFPKQTELGENDYGNLVKLPLALHLASGRRSFFYNDLFEPELDYKKTLAFHLAHKDSIPKVIVKEKTIIIGKSEGNPNACAFLDYALAHELPVGKRHEVISRNMAYYIHDKPDCELLKEQYIKMQKGNSHEMEGWLKGIERGKAVPLCCGELINYQKEHKIPLKCKGCKRFEEWVKEKKIEEKLKKEIDREHKNTDAKEIGYLADAISSQFTDYHDMAEKFIKDVCPIYYDTSKNFWAWNPLLKCYMIVDETDVLNKLDAKIKNPTCNSKIKNEILEAFRRVGRKNKPKEFNKEWIQFRNKIINFKTGETIEVSPEYFATNPIPWDVGDEENTPIMDKLFTEWVGEENVDSLYQILAYCLLVDYPIHRLFCFIGAGSNGKSSFIKLIEKFIGDHNICSTELDVLTKSRFEAAKLYKKLACFMGETNFTELSQTSTIKRLTGQDLMGVEWKNKALLDARNYAKILISTNNLPATTDKTPGFYRRWFIIDFPNKFAEGRDIIEDIPEIEFNNLSKKSVRVLKELLEAKAFHNEGTIEQRAEKYEAKSNPFDKFWNEEISEDLDSFIPKHQFREIFDGWCKENGFRKLSDMTVAEQMKNKGIETKKVVADWYTKEGTKPQIRAWAGIRWKKDIQV